MRKLFLVFINGIYWLFGTRVTEKQIYGDLVTADDVHGEYLSVMRNYLITGFYTRKLRVLSVNRLKAIGMRATELLLGNKKVSWDYVTSDEYFVNNVKVIIGSYLGEDVDFREGSIITRTTIEEGLIKCPDEELDRLFLLCQYLIQKLKEKGN